MIVDSPSGLRDGTPDLRVVPSNFGVLAFLAVVDALQSVELALLGGALAVIRALLTLVRRLIPIIGYAVSFVSDAVPLIGHQVAPQLFGFTNPERALAAVEVGVAPIRFAPGTSLSAIGHSQP
ncbi:hypothetical protein [Mycolicibacterium sp. CBMA 226]|uniref:hypothetical protein n=1 Tax=Mycolicibacterium sp. CBMA 226 TaxID=2606611 RepID=UPI0012DE8C4C|nr:hypothetical protein [Mycolicibacterium sp. CBMA 226]